MVEIEEPECSICFNKIGERNNCVTPCGHLFCFTCIIEVIRHDSNTCPNCRSSFTEENTIINDNNYNNNIIINNNENIINNNNENIINNNENINNDIINIINNNNIINNYINNNNENIFNNYINNNENIFNDNILITDDNESILSNSEYSTSISDIPDEESYIDCDDNCIINPKSIRLYEDEDSFDKITKIVSILLQKGFDENDIRYIIRKNFNYYIMTENKECDNQELIFTEQTIENINILQNELNKILNDLEVKINNNDGP